MPGEEFPVRWSGETAVVTFPAEVDLTVADAAREALLAVLNQGAALLVVDMTPTTFCDSAGVSVIVRAARRASAGGGSIRLATSSATVLRVFSLVGIDRLIEIHPTVADAVGDAMGPPVLA
ncbi:MAG: STAS domain-containing protein [Trebonia sp.]